MKNFIDILEANRGRGSFSVQAKDQEATIYLYDAIVNETTASIFGGVSAKAFIEELKKITAKTIHLRINSPGGEVFSARAIEQAIREKDARVIAHVDGYAASAASFIAMAADEVVMSDGGFFMIHESRGGQYGPSAELRAMADLLDQIDASMIRTYAKKTGKSEEEIKAAMKAETWYSASDSISFGLADRVETGLKAAALWDIEGAPKIEATHTKIPDIDLRKMKLHLMPSF